jgi:hypothetical protein
MRARSASHPLLRSRERHGSQERPEHLLTVSRTTLFLRVPGKSILDRRFGDKASTVRGAHGS